MDLKIVLYLSLVSEVYAENTDVTIVLESCNFNLLQAAQTSWSSEPLTLLMQISLSK